MPGHAIFRHQPKDRSVLGQHVVRTHAILSRAVGQYVERFPKREFGVVQHKEFDRGCTRRMVRRWALDDQAGNVLRCDQAALAAQAIVGVVDQSQLDQDLSYVDIGKSEGATLHWGGELLNRETPGFYMQPALFTNVANTMRVAREEIFGPVGVVIRAKNYDEALAISNDTEFGLSAGICTSSLKYATHFKRNSEAGMVMVNLPTAGVDYHVPFGGRKVSSYGQREQGRHAIEFFTVTKTHYTLAI